MIGQQEAAAQAQDSLSAMKERHFRMLSISMQLTGRGADMHHTNVLNINMYKLFCAIVVLGQHLGPFQAK